MDCKHCGHSYSNGNELHGIEFPPSFDLPAHCGECFDCSDVDELIGYRAELADGRTDDRIEPRRDYGDNRTERRAACIERGDHGNPDACGCYE